jgi:hypothetical protein
VGSSRIAPCILTCIRSVVRTGCYTPVKYNPPSPRALFNDLNVTLSACQHANKTATHSAHTSPRRSLLSQWRMVSMFLCQCNYVCAPTKFQLSFCLRPRHLHVKFEQQQVQMPSAKLPTHQSTKRQSTDRRLLTAQQTYTICISLLLIYSRHNITRFTIGFIATCFDSYESSSG